MDVTVKVSFAVLVSQKSCEYSLNATTRCLQRGHVHPLLGEVLTLTLTLLPLLLLLPAARARPPPPPPDASKSRRGTTWSPRRPSKYSEYSELVSELVS